MTNQRHLLIHSGIPAASRESIDGAVSPVGGGERRARGEPWVHTSLDAAAACGRQTHRRRVRRVLYADRSELS